MKTIRCLLLTVLSLFLLWKTEVFNTNAMPVDDFVEYWAAARLQIHGLNPYSAHEILALERAVGMQGDEPLVMLNPPWTLTFLLPFGFLDYFAGRLVWLILQLLLILISIRWLLLVYQGSFQVALALTFCFVPLLVCLILGQITPLVLLGVAGFLHFERRLKPIIAGACLVLLTVKPQLFYLFWLALLLWILYGRRWRILLGASVCGVITVALSAIWNPAIFSQYVELTSRQPPMLHWRTPTLGTLLRAMFGMQHSWLQVVPMFAGVSWLLLHWKRRYANWDWSAQMPLILMVCLSTTAYVWFYDQMLILPAILQVYSTVGSCKKEQQRSMVAAFSMMNVILVVQIIFKLPPLFFVWSFGCWLILYWFFFLRGRMLCVSQTVGPIAD